MGDYLFHTCMTCKLSCSLTLQRGNLLLILFIICKAQKHKYGGLDANFSQSNETTWLKPHVGQFIEIAKYGNRLPCSTKSGGAPIRQNSPLSLKQSFPFGTWDWNAITALKYISQCSIDPMIIADHSRQNMIGP